MPANCVSQHAEQAQREWPPPAQPQHLGGDGAITAAVAQQVGSNPASPYYVTV